MRIAIPAAIVVILAAVAFCLLGRGGTGGATADTAPFEAAIAQYLEDKNMGMKVTEFRSLDVEGSAAHAVCRMMEQSGLHNVKVTWQFEFERKADGTWVALSHQRD